MTRLTVVLHNWMRPENLKEIIAALRRQTERPEIVLWNNNPATDCSGWGADWCIQSSRNNQVFAVPWLWQQATTPFVMRMDDDLIPTDDRLLADACDCLGRVRDATRMIGAYGKNLDATNRYSYRRGRDVLAGPNDQPVDMLKGRIMLAHREAAFRVPVRDHHPHMDLVISNSLAGVNRHHHIVPALFHRRLRNMPEGDVGYSAQPDHYRHRQELTDRWLKQLFGSPGDPLPLGITALSGLTTDDELRFVADCARNAPAGHAVELGTFRGRTCAAICSARGQQPVTTIDSWEMRHHGANGPEIARKNLDSLGFRPEILSQKTVPVPDSISDIAFLLVDSSHGGKETTAELEAWVPRVLPGGIVCLHDYGSPTEIPMTVAINEFFRRAGWERVGLVGTLVAHRKGGNAGN